jgi:hypothetical protein
MRVFGSWEAYEATKPNRYWVRSLYGWYKRQALTRPENRPRLSQ